MAVDYKKQTPVFGKEQSQSSISFYKRQPSRW